MTVNDSKQKNERGREISYRVIEYCSGMELFSFKARRFSTARVRRECKEHNASLPVVVKWTTMNRWGVNMRTEVVQEVVE